MGEAYDARLELPGWAAPDTMTSGGIASSCSMIRARNLSPPTDRACAESKSWHQFLGTGRPE